MKGNGKAEFEIIQAGLEQEEGVLKLWALLMENYGKQPAPDLLRQSFRYAAVHPEQVRVFVARQGGKVLGTVSLHLGHFSTWSNNWYGHVEDLIVHPGERGRGVAAGLVQHIVQAARREGLSRLELHTQPGNKAARAIYEKLGFECSSVLYDLSLN